MGWFIPTLYLGHFHLGPATVSYLELFKLDEENIKTNPPCLFFFHFSDNRVPGGPKVFQDISTEVLKCPTRVSTGKIISLFFSIENNLKKRK